MPESFEEQLDAAQARIAEIMGEAPEYSYDHQCASSILRAFKGKYNLELPDKEVSLSAVTEALWGHGFFTTFIFGAAPFKSKWLWKVTLRDLLVSRKKPENQALIKLYREFCKDYDVYDAAASRQMVHVMFFRIGKGDDNRGNYVVMPDGLDTRILRELRCSVITIYGAGLVVMSRKDFCNYLQELING